VWHLLEDSTAVKHALYTLLCLVQQSPRKAKENLVALGLLYCVVAALRPYPVHINIQRLGVTILHGAVADTIEDRAMPIIWCGGIHVLTECLTTYLHHEDMLLISVTAISALAQNQHNKNALVQANVLPLLTRILLLHPLNASLQEQCRKALYTIAWKYVRLWKQVEMVGGKHTVLAAMKSVGLCFFHGMIVDQY